MIEFVFSVFNKKKKSSYKYIYGTFINFALNRICAREIFRSNKVFLEICRRGGDIVIVNGEKN